MGTVKRPLKDRSPLVRQGERVYIVESLGWGEVRVVESHGEGVALVSTSRLPRPLREGTRIRVPLGADGEPVWSMATFLGVAGYPELAYARRTARLSK